MEKSSHGGSYCKRIQAPASGGCWGLCQWTCALYCTIQRYSYPSARAELLCWVDQQDFSEKGSPNLCGLSRYGSLFSQRKNKAYWQSSPKGFAGPSWKKGVGTTEIWFGSKSQDHFGFGRIPRSPNPQLRHGEAHGRLGKSRLPGALAEWKILFQGHGSSLGNRRFDTHPFAGVYP